jgi:capsular exopolysaccharide synthesis family protein
MEKQTENLPALLSTYTHLPATVAAPVPTAEPEESGVPLAHYFWVLRRQSWKIALFVVVSLIVTFVISSKLQPIYESTATINIERQGPEGVVGDQALHSPGSADAEVFITTQTKIMQSDSVLRPVAEKFHLLSREQSGQRATGSTGPVKLTRLKVSRAQNTYLVLISYRSTDPQLSADVANAVARSYVEHIYRMQIDSATSASGFMTKQLDDLKARMERSSAALAQFEKELNVINPEQKTNITSQRLLQLNTEYTNAQADRVRKEAAFNSTKSGSLAAIQVSGQAESLQHLQERINDAREKFTEVRASKGPNHPDYIKAQLMLTELTQQFQVLRDNIAQRINAEFQEASVREQMLARALQDTKADYDQLNLRSFDYLRLKEEAEADKKLYEELVRRIQEGSINAGFQNKNIAVSDFARPAVKAVFPNVQMNMVTAGVLALLLGICAAMLSDSLDVTVRDPELIQRLYQTDLLGTLPALKDVRLLQPVTAYGKPEDSALATQKQLQNNLASEFDEGVRMLRNSILLSDFDRNLRSILLTSATPGEGKSTVAMHLAIAHARQGKKTLLIDADLRRPTLDTKIGLPKTERGLSAVVQNEATWDETVIEVPYCPNLHLLPAGRCSRRISDLVGATLPDVIDDASRLYDLVIVDAPPILGFAEPMQIATIVDGVLIVAVAGETNRKAIGSMLSALRRLKSNVLGIVLNRMTKDSTSGYYYYRYSDYYLYAGKSAEPVQS